MVPRERFSVVSVQHANLPPLVMRYAVRHLRIDLRDTCAGVHLCTLSWNVGSPLVSCSFKLLSSALGAKLMSGAN